MWKFPNRASLVFTHLKYLAKTINAKRVLVFGLGSAQVVSILMKSSARGMVIDALLGNNREAMIFLAEPVKHFTTTNILLGMHLTVIEPKSEYIEAVKHMIGNPSRFNNQVSFEHKTAEAFVNGPSFNSGYYF